MNKTDILTQALEARDNEILGYQINIDNYRLAIAKIQAEHPENADLAEFRADLEARLAEELRQQLRMRIIRDVIADQLQEP
jgi:hypothetical protein